MPLTDDQKTAIAAWFQGHAVEERCVICSAADYVLADKIYSLPARGPNFGQCVHLVVTVCPNCMHSRLFSADGMDLPGFRGGYD